MKKIIKYIFALIFFSSFLVDASGQTQTVTIGSVNGRTVRQYCSQQSPQSPVNCGPQNTYIGVKQALYETEINNANVNEGVTDKFYFDFNLSTLPSNIWIENFVIHSSGTFTENKSVLYPGSPVAGYLGYNNVYINYVQWDGNTLISTSPDINQSFGSAIPNNVMSNPNKTFTIPVQSNFIPPANTIGRISCAGVNFSNVTFTATVTYSLINTAITGLGVEDLSCSNYKLTWDPLSNAIGYNIFVDGVFIQSTTTNSATCNLPSGQLVVTAFNPGLTFAKSQIVIIQPKQDFAVDLSGGGTYNNQVFRTNKTGRGLGNGFTFTATKSSMFTLAATPSCSGDKVIRNDEESDQENKQVSDSKTVSSSCFPNPTHGEFTVRMNLPEHQTSEIRVYDSMGKLVKTVVASATETLVSIEDQPAGIYFVRYTVDGKDHSAKVVKL